MIALAIVLAVLLLLACLPLGVRLEYWGGKARVLVVAGPIHMTLFPQKPRKPKVSKKPQHTKKKQEQPKEPKEKKSKDIAGLLALIKPFFGLARSFLNSFRRHLQIRTLVLHVRYGGSDPAEAALHYGQAWAAIGCVVPVLQTVFHIQKQDIQAIYDDSNAGFSAEASVLVTIFLYELLGMGIKYGIQAGKRLLPLLKKNKKKAVQNHESSTS